jgi:hypothetical protein
VLFVRVVLAATPVEGILEIAKCALSSSVTAERLWSRRRPSQSIILGPSILLARRLRRLAAFFVIPDFAALVPLAFTNAV